MTWSSLVSRLDCHSFYGLRCFKNFKKERYGCLSGACVWFCFNSNKFMYKLCSGFEIPSLLDLIHFFVYLRIFEIWCSQASLETLFKLITCFCCLPIKFGLGFLLQLLFVVSSSLYNSLSIMSWINLRKRLNLTHNFSPDRLNILPLVT